MISNNDDEELVMRFLSGLLSDDELKLFLIRLESDEKVRNILNDNIELEGLLLEQMKINPAVKGFQKEHDWAQAIICELTLPDKNECSLSEMHCVEIIKSIYKQIDSNKKVMIPFPKAVKFLAVACLVLSTGMAVFFYSNFFGKENVESTVVKNNHIKEKIVFFNLSDSVFEQQKIETDNETGVVRFRGKTGFLAEKKTSVLMREKKDTIVILELTDGSALFNVEKEKYSKFTVFTPHVRITVTGTIFRVTINNDHSEVSVIEGSVKIFHNLSGVKKDLSSGNSIFADKDSINIVDMDILFEMPKRKLLAGFLEQQWEKEQYPNVIKKAGYDSAQMLNTITRECAQISHKNGSHETRIEELLDYYYKNEMIDSSELLMYQMYSDGNKPFKDDYKVFKHAEYLRDHGCFRNAIDWFSFYAEYFPEGKEKHDAVYQIGWCLIQDRLENMKKRSYK